MLESAKVGHNFLFRLARYGLHGVNSSVEGPSKLLLTGCIRYSTMSGEVRGDGVLYWSTHGTILYAENSAILQYFFGLLRLDP